MASLQSIRLKQQLWDAGIKTNNISLKQRRVEWEQSVKDAVLPDGISVEKKSIKQCDAEWLTLSSVSPEKKVILYLHGGGYAEGSAQTHRCMVAHMVKHAAIPALVLNYRLAPEYPFPSAVQDSMDAFLWLGQQGYTANQIFVAGDSSGGGLALALMLTLKGNGQELPAAAALLSPWVDLTLSGSTLKSKDTIDPIVDYYDLIATRAFYCKSEHYSHPCVSPLFADLSGFPPLLILVGSDEVLLDDARRLSLRAKELNVAVDYQEWSGMWHVWPSFAGKLPEADEALKVISSFFHAKSV